MKRTIKSMTAMILALVICVVTSGTVMAFSVTSIEKTNYLNLNKELKSISDDGKRIIFSCSKNGLYLYDGSKQNRLMIIDKKAGRGFEYSITRINFSDPNMTLWEIQKSTGHAGTDFQYWIIGKRNGKWVSYVTEESLRNMGGMIGWPIIRGKNENGNFVISCRDFSRREVGTYLRLKMFWDPQAEWMGLEAI